MDTTWNTTASSQASSRDDVQAQLKLIRARRRLEVARMDLQEAELEMQLRQLDGASDTSRLAYHALSNCGSALDSFDFTSDITPRHEDSNALFIPSSNTADSLHQGWLSTGERGEQMAFGDQEPVSDNMADLIDWDVVNTAEGIGSEDASGRSTQFPTVLEPASFFCSNSHADTSGQMFGPRYEDMQSQLVGTTFMDKTVNAEHEQFAFPTDLSVIERATTFQRFTNASENSTDYQAHTFQPELQAETGTFTSNVPDVLRYAPLPNKRKRKATSSPTPSCSDPTISSSAPQCATLEVQGPVRAISYTSCFYARPPPKRLRRAMTEQEQMAINRLRLRGACFRCRKLRLKCSEKDPCQNCVSALKSNTFKDLVLETCVRSFSDANFFKVWEQTPSRMFSGIRAAFLRCLRVLLPFLDRRVQAENGLDVLPSSRTIRALRTIRADYSTRVLRAIDDNVKKKSFWTRENDLEQLAVVVTCDLILSFCVFQISSAHSASKELLRTSNVASHAFCQPSEALMQICKFNIEKLISLRTSIVRNRGSKIQSIFEDVYSKCCEGLRNQLPPALRRNFFIIMYDFKYRGYGNEKYASGKRLLRYSIGTGLGSLCRFASTLGTDPNLDKYDREFLIKQAVIENDIEVLRSLLDAGFGTRIVDEERGSPFELAVDKKRVAAVDVLIEKGIFPPLSRYWLNYLTLRENVWALERLFETKRLPNLRHVHCSTALCRLMEQGHEHAVQVLLRNGVDVNRQCADGDTALHKAASMDSVPFVELLLEAGSLLEGKNFLGNTALHIATRENSDRVVEYLISRGANLDACNDRSKTPLLLAACNGHLNVLQQLLLAGANFPAARRIGQWHSLLESSSQDIQDDKVNSLKALAAGVILAHFQRHIKDAHNQLSQAPYSMNSDSPLQQVSEEPFSSPRHLLIERCNASNKCVWHESMLTEDGYRLAARVFCGENFFHVAAKEGCLATVMAHGSAFKSLLKASNDDGETPLQIAHRLGFERVARAIQALLSDDDGSAVPNEALVGGVFTLPYDEFETLEIGSWGSDRCEDSDTDEDVSEIL